MEEPTKRTRRTKEQIESDELLKAEQPKEFKPVRKKGIRKKAVKQKDKSNYLPANVDPTYLVSETARTDCYVYAVTKVTFDETLKRQLVSKQQLLTYRVAQLHSTAIWGKGGEGMLVNTIKESLISQYGMDNVIEVNILLITNYKRKEEYTTN